MTKKMANRDRPTSVRTTTIIEDWSSSVRWRGGIWNMGRVGGIIDVATNSETICERFRATIYNMGDNISTTLFYQGLQ